MGLRACSWRLSWRGVAMSAWSVVAFVGRGCYILELED